tara:strand:- start:375 stop:620 length:246 start_codon:yes stop_codon:yes gene_type:complete
MGKKRRLNTAKAKFKSKHATHPRMQYLNSQEETVVETQPEVVLQEEKVEEMPKAAPKRKHDGKASPKRRFLKKTRVPEALT